MKTYLIIGAGPGIGVSTAQRFANEEFRIVLASRSENGVKAAVSALRASGATVEVATIDAVDPQGVASLVKRYGADLAVLHYNIGVLHYNQNGELQTRALEQDSVDTLTSELHMNLISALAATKAAAELMATRGEGSILLTGGGFGVDPTPAFLGVSVAKSGLRAAAKALFEPMKDKGIHLATVTVSTLVSPGSEKATEVAEAFWELHAQNKMQWGWESVVK